MRLLRRGMALTAVLLMSLVASGCGTMTNSALGTWSAEEGQAELEFTYEGVVSGTDGCNRVSGYWHQDGDEVTFYGLEATAMACPDVATWLADPATATVQGGTMTFYDSGHEQIGQLDRQ